MNIAKVLSDLMKNDNIDFSFRGEIIDHGKVFADVGLLPALVKRADENASLCLGYDLGAIYDENDNAMLGHRVQFDETTPEILRLMFIYDVIINIVAAAENKKNVILDELAYDWL